MKFFVPLLAILCASSPSSAAAKAGYAELGLVEVSGTVTLDGKPLAAGQGHLRRRRQTHSRLGMTDSAGHYTLMYDSQTRGTTPGPKTVRITTAEVDVEGGGAAEGAAAAKETAAGSLQRQSELKADVSATQKDLQFRSQVRALKWHKPCSKSGKEDRGTLINANSR